MVLTLPSGKSAPRELLTNFRLSQPITLDIQKW